MKRIVLIPLLALLAAPALHAQAPITINPGEPGYYGPIEIDDSYPKPRLMFSDPRVIDGVHRTGRPLYLHIPPGHAKDWEKHCKHYDACHQPAYFVEDSWYSDEYVPAYQKRHGEMGKAKGPGKGPGYGQDQGQSQGQGKGYGKDQSQGQGQGYGKDQSQGQGQGKGKDKDKDLDRDEDR